MLIITTSHLFCGCWYWKCSPLSIIAQGVWTQLYQEVNRVTLHCARLRSSFETVGVLTHIPSSYPAWIWVTGRQQSPIVKTGQWNWKHWVQILAPPYDLGYISVLGLRFLTEYWVRYKTYALWELTETILCNAEHEARQTAGTCYVYSLLSLLMIFWMSLILVPRGLVTNSEDGTAAHQEKISLWRHWFICLSLNIRTNVPNLFVNDLSFYISLIHKLSIMSSSSTFWKTLHCLVFIINSRPTNESLK